MENILEAMKKDIFAKHIGIEIIEAGEGKAVGRLKTSGDHLNGLGIVHGGVIFSLADTTFAAASNSREGIAVAANVSISYCKAAQQGTLVARAEEVSLSRKLATYLVKVFDEEDSLVALFQGTVYRKVK
ncbi:MAG: hotdog fold thioesterase [Peptococcaceae bacterium]|nr:hotdog fold thioesterase [Peptococcaceae bacterium]